MMGHGPVQPSWDNPNCGWHTAHPDDPLDGHQGLRASTAGSPAGRGKGMGATPTLYGVAWWWWRCRSNRHVVVAPTITVIVTVAVAWASDFM
jgi:hypothetical protein